MGHPRPATHTVTADSPSVTGLSARPAAAPSQELDQHPCPHRRGAIDDVRAELSDGRPETEPTVAIRSYGHGRLAVGVAGPVDRAVADRLATLLDAVHVLSSRELVLTFGLLTRCDHHLARVISRARMAHLVEGGQVELDNVPAALLVDLDLGATPGASPTSAFVVTDGDPRRA